MKNLVIFILLTSFSLLGAAQHVRLTYQPGYGIYKLKDLRDFQKEVAENEDLPPLKMVESFPSYFNHTLLLELRGPAPFSFGFHGGYTYTGARNHYHDYSGEYKLDLQLNAFQLGINARYTFPSLLPVKNDPYC